RGRCSVHLLECLSRIPFPFLLGAGRPTPAVRRGAGLLSEMQSLGVEALEKRAPKPLARGLRHPGRTTEVFTMVVAHRPPLRFPAIFARVSGRLANYQAFLPQSWLLRSRQSQGRPAVAARPTRTAPICSSARLVLRVMPGVGRRCVHCVIVDVEAV